MPVRTWPAALAAHLLALLGALTATADGAPPSTRIGIFCNRPNSVAIGRALGVRYQRYIMPVDGLASPGFARILAAEAAGFKLNVQFNNVVSPAAAHGRSGPVADDRAYETALAADLDATHPDLVTIQNEEDGLEFWDGSPADYLHELSDAVQVAHARGYRISNGGLTSTGVKLAYWHHLWITGQHGAADRFAREALTPDVTHGITIWGDIPDSADPARPVLGHNDRMAAKLARVESLLAGYRKTGVDYVNFHWYETSPDDLRRVVAWLSAVTGLPAISNEMGQQSASPDRVNGLLETALAARMPYVFWFAIDAHGGAVGLTDPDGVPRANGAAFKAFVAAHP